MHRELGVSLDHVCDASRSELSFDEDALKRLLGNLKNGLDFGPGLFARYYDLVRAIEAQDAELAVTLLLPESLPPGRRRRDNLGAVFGVYGALLRDRVYMAYVLSGGLIMAGMFAYIAASPFVFIELFHVAPPRYGLYFGTNALGLITASQVNGRLARRVNPQTILKVVLPTTAAAGVVLVISAWTGIPVGKMKGDEIQTVLSLKDRLQQRVLDVVPKLDGEGRRPPPARDAGEPGPEEPDAEQHHHRERL